MGEVLKGMFFDTITERSVSVNYENEAYFKRRILSFVCQKVNDLFT